MTNRGTIATLRDASICAINEQTARQARDKQATTNENEKNEKKEKKKKKYPVNSVEFTPSSLLLKLITARRSDVDRVYASLTVASQVLAIRLAPAMVGWTPSPAQ